MVWIKNVPHFKRASLYSILNLAELKWKKILSKPLRNNLCVCVCVCVWEINIYDFDDYDVCVHLNHCSL